MNLATRVLIVDDEERFRTTLAKILKAEGLDATVAGDAREGLDALAAAEFDVVLLDVKMPGMDGIEALKRIKNMGDPGCNVEVIILTGHASVDYAVEIMKYGAFDFLLKPCPKDELLVKISLAHERKIERCGG